MSIEYIEQIQPRKAVIEGDIATSIDGIFSLQIDDVYPLTYLGEAAPGTATSEAGWRIKRIDETNTPDTVILYAGTGTFDQVWDDRASLSYA